MVPATRSPLATVVTAVLVVTSARIAAATLERGFRHKVVLRSQQHAPHDRLVARVASIQNTASKSVGFFWEGGVADAASGMMTAFYYSILTERRLCISDSKSLPWTTAFDAGTHVPNLFDCPSPSTALRLRFDFNSGPRWPAAGAMVEDVAFHTMDLTHFVSIATGNKSSDNVDHFTLSTHLGMVHAMFSNPFHASQLQDLDVSIDDAFLRAWHILFKPKEIVSAELELMPFPENAPVIAIQPRVGDDVWLRQQSVDLARVEPFFECAETIERNEGTPNTKVYWLVISDSLHVRREALNRWSDKVWTPDIVPENVMVDQNGGKITNKAFVNAVSEMLIMSRADYFVVTNSSGFGKIAYLISNRKKALFAVEMSTRRSCALNESDALPALYDHLTGYR